MIEQIMCKKKRLNVKVLGCNTVCCNLSGLHLTGPVRGIQATHVTQSRAVGNPLRLLLLARLSVVSLSNQKVSFLQDGLQCLLYHFEGAPFQSTRCDSRYFCVQSSHDRMWKLCPLIFTSPPRAMSEGVIQSRLLSTFLYLFL